MDSNHAENKAIAAQVKEPMVAVDPDDPAVKILTIDGAAYRVDGADFDYFAEQNDSLIEPQLVKTYLMERGRIKTERTA